MNNSFINVLIAWAIISVPLAGSALESGEDKEPEYELPAYEFVETVTLPKPRRSPIPKVSQHLAGTTVDLKFTVNEKGHPENVRLVKPLSSYNDDEKMTFATQTLEAVSKWRFEPALDINDKPVAVKVIMPVRVVKYGKIYKALASVVLDDAGKRP